MITVCMRRNRTPSHLPHSSLETHVTFPQFSKLPTLCASNILTVTSLSSDLLTAEGNYKPSLARRRELDRLRWTLTRRPVCSTVVQQGVNHAGEGAALAEIHTSSALEGFPDLSELERPASPQNAESAFHLTLRGGGGCLFGQRASTFQLNRQK